MRGLNIPFTRMGKVTSEHLFEDREQSIFDFYERNAGRYQTALDIGANIGVHSILMARAGWRVTAYEPDPTHFERLKANLEAHGCAEFAELHAVPINLAVATQDGRAEFVRVLDNETANHLAGARGHHGHIQRIQVGTIDCRSIFAWADFAKIDCEGMEAALLCTVTDESCEFLVEVGTQENAMLIFRHFFGRRSMWRQMDDAWKAIRRLDDMPMHYTHGSLFIGKRPC